MLRSSSKFGLLAAALLLGVASPSASWGAEAVTQNEAVAEEHVRQGLTLRRDHHDLAALEEFRRAYELAPSPRIYAQVAFALQALGRWVEAEAALLAVLRADDPWVAQHGDVLREALADVQRHLAWIRVDTAAVGAKFTLDGVPRERLDRRTRVDVGHHRLSIEAGGRSQTREVDLAPGDQWVVSFDPTRRLEAGSSPTIDEAPTWSPRRAVAVGTAGLAVLGLVNAVGALVIRNDFVSQYNGPKCLPPRSDTCHAERTAALTAETVMGVSFGVAAASALVSTWLFLRKPTERSLPVAHASVERFELRWSVTF